MTKFISFINSLKICILKKYKFYFIKGTLFLYKFCKLLILKGYIKQIFWIYKNYIKFYLIIILKYIGKIYKSLINNIKILFSKTQKFYIKYKNLHLYNKKGFFIISTIYGLMSTLLAYLLKIGGQLICYIY
jgi:ribosomal protein S8